MPPQHRWRQPARLAAACPVSFCCTLVPAPFCVHVCIRPLFCCNLPQSECHARHACEFGCQVGRRRATQGGTGRRAAAVRIVNFVTPSSFTPRAFNCCIGCILSYFRVLVSCGGRSAASPHSRLERAVAIRLGVCSHPTMALRRLQPSLLAGLLGKQQTTCGSMCGARGFRTSGE